MASPPDSQSVGLGETKLIARTSNSVIVDVETNETCALVLSDAYYPGWRAEIDGEATQIFPAYHAFRGIIVPAGAHRVEFKYEPRVFQTGLLISLAAIAASIVIGSAAIAQRRSA